MESIYAISSTLAVIALVLILIIGIIAYLLVLSRVIGRYAMPVRYRTDAHLGRGLHRFTYPEGRAVLYEPHPSIRKYIRRYLLFTLNGYKYLRLRLDGGVNDFAITVVMHDNKNRVVDVIEVNGRSGGSKYSKPIQLNEKTSYVALMLTSVNGVPRQKASYMETPSYALAIYFAITSLVTFLQFAQITYVFSLIFRVTASSNPLSLPITFFILPSLCVGALCLGVMLASRHGKGVKVVLK